MPPTASNQDADRKSGMSLDKLLSEDQQEVFFAVIERTTLREGALWLAKNHQIKLSPTAIGKWAAKQRRKASDYQFSCLLAEIRIDNEQATRLAGEIGSAAQLNDANVAMLSSALFQASRSGDPAELKQAAKLFSMVMESTAKAKAANAAVIAAETSRDRFQFDAAKLALEHVEALQAIKSSNGSDREKVERAVLTVFGRRPEPETLPNSGGGSDVGTGASAGKFLSQFGGRVELGAHGSIDNAVSGKGEN